ncbi:MLP-like protein 43 [Senna tora]|uniref:MLP-like protein 43 n=1 Tax=Senna tora TaxID=362788 RepID=A0A834W995_9FABA|nr:MLP-like protein 43 [Senna tora]
MVKLLPLRAPKQRRKFFGVQDFFSKRREEGYERKSWAEIEIQSSASKFFNLFVTQVHEIQNITDEVHQIKLHQGDWHGLGSHSVKHWTYTLGGKVVNCKEHFEEIDRANKTLTLNIFDRHASELYKMLKGKIKVVEKGEGALVKWTYKYEKVHEAIPPPQAYLDLAIKVVKDVDAHLLKA